VILPRVPPEIAGRSTLTLPDHPTISGANGGEALAAAHF
jgi:hypothetical protein